MRFFRKDFHFGLPVSPLPPVLHRERARDAAAIQARNSEVWIAAFDS
jgi:hypothetical protein